MKDKPTIIAKIKGDAGKYTVWGIDWLNHKMLIERACGYEQILFDKITILESDADAQNNGVSDREILFWMMNESSTQWEGSPSYEWVCRFYKALRKGKFKAHRDNLIKKG